MKTKRSKIVTIKTRITALAFILPALTGWSIEYNLIGAASPINVPGDVGGTALVANYWQQPTGTGVFDPFLTIDHKTIEKGYNTDGSPLYMDQQRPHWNTTLTLGSLAQIQLNGNNYYAFVLDANEQGNAANRILSVDNVRIYTSAIDNTGIVGNDISKLNNLGTLRWALNDPTMSGGTYNVADWIKLDASQENVGFHSNGGSGQADMVLYVPVSAFAQAKATDFVWFFNLNGVKYNTDAGFEEWRACLGTKVPDGGMTVGLLGLALAAMGIVARKLA